MFFFCRNDCFLGSKMADGTPRRIFESHSSSMRAPFLKGGGGSFNVVCGRSRFRTNTKLLRGVISLISKLNDYLNTRKFNDVVSQCWSCKNDALLREGRVPTGIALIYYNSFYGRKKSFLTRRVYALYKLHNHLKSEKGFKF